MNKKQREAAAALAAAGTPGTPEAPAADSTPGAEQGSSTDAADDDAADDAADDAEAEAEAIGAEAIELMTRFGLKRCAIDRERSIHFDTKHIESLQASGVELLIIER
ncbi:hypothetical protein Q5H92_21870 [Hymenobacter sp. M29]|uniref:Uncharacterized protein n=1 Tax=Hymenobacter mellowenesis TaxID=3063995 RepID=A0ABT9AGN1_9BACT|nr:hypothetical protein [Hymenobacter sp. M29]MDO7849028.1 hypothetical protein [Hymenobacter sp. M29]